jgi:ATP-dependent RNA helicase MSS116
MKSKETKKVENKHESSTAEQNVNTLFNHHTKHRTGRMQDHLSNTPGFVGRLARCQTLILDEADQLLDQGFRPAIEKIMRDLPRERHTLCFSATIPASLQQVTATALKPDFVYVDCVGADDDGTHAADRVPQGFAVTEMGEQMAALFNLVTDEMRDDAQHKVRFSFPV